MTTEVKEPQPVYTEQPTAPAQPSYRVTTGTEPWQHDLFDCFEGADNLCLKGTFCPCFVYGKTQARLRNPTLQGYERFNSDCITWGAAQYCGLAWVIQFIKRGEMRQQYSIKGDTLSDCLVSAFCHCCALIQQEKEVISRNEQGGGVVQQGYVAPPAGMVVEPPKTQ